MVQGLRCLRGPRKGPEGISEQGSPRLLPARGSCSPPGEALPAAAPAHGIAELPLWGLRLRLQPRARLPRQPGWLGRAAQAPKARGTLCCRLLPRGGQAGETGVARSPRRLRTPAGPGVPTGEGRCPQPGALLSSAGVSGRLQREKPRTRAGSAGLPEHQDAAERRGQSCQVRGAHPGLCPGFPGRAPSAASAGHPVLSLDGLGKEEASLRRPAWSPAALGRCQSTSGGCGPG